MHRADYDDWLFLMKTGIAAASIAIQVRDHNRDGWELREEDMARFEEEARTVAEVWLDVIRKGETSDPAV